MVLVKQLRNVMFDYSVLYWWVGVKQQKRHAQVPIPQQITGHCHSARHIGGAGISLYGALISVRWAEGWYHMYFTLVARVLPRRYSASERTACDSSTNARRKRRNSAPLHFTKSCNTVKTLLAMYTSRSPSNAHHLSQTKVSCRGLA